MASNFDHHPALYAPFDLLAAATTVYLTVRNRFREEAGISGFVELINASAILQSAFTSDSSEDLQLVYHLFRTALWEQQDEKRLPE